MLVDSQFKCLFPIADLPKTLQFFLSKARFVLQFVELVLCFSVVTSDDENVDRPKRLRKKRRRKEDETSEDIIDGFSIRSFKTYPILLQYKENELTQTPSDIITIRKEESTETSSANGNTQEDSYVCKSKMQVIYFI